MDFGDWIIDCSHVIYQVYQRPVYGSNVNFEIGFYAYLVFGNCRNHTLWKNVNVNKFLEINLFTDFIHFMLFDDVVIPPKWLEVLVMKTC